MLGAGSAYGLYSRFGAAMPRGSGAFTVYRNDHWMFAGTGLRYGDLLGAAIGWLDNETVGCSWVSTTTNYLSRRWRRVTRLKSRSSRSRRRRIAMASTPHR